MAELIDILFLFWFVVAGGVYLIGSIYEKHLKEKQKLEAKRRRRLESQSRVDDWRPSDSRFNYNDTTSTQANRSSTSQYDSSHQYNNNNYNNHDSTASNQFNYSSYTNPYSAQHTDGGAFYLSQNRFNENSYAASNNFGQTVRQTDFGHYDAASPNASIGSDGHRHWARDQQAQFHGSEPAPVDRSIPTATGFNSDCVDWVNRILFLFYSQPNKYGPIIAENVCRSLNEKMSGVLSSSVEFADWMLEFRSIDLAASTKPELKNVRTESESDKSVSAVCKIYNQRLVCELRLQRSRLGSTTIRVATMLSQQNDTIVDELHYELTLENLEGKLKSVAMFGDKLIVVQFMEKPDTKILLRPIGHRHQHNQTKPNEDSLVSLILQSLTQMVVDLYFGDDLEFPQFVKQHPSGGYRNKLSQLKGSANEIKRQIKHDFLGALSLGAGDNSNKERKLFVKLLRAKNINYNQTVTCILELDHPEQQAISSTKQGSNPLWDESFLFLINEKSAAGGDKLTLELWDSLDPLSIRAAKQESASRQQQQPKKLAGRSFNKSELTASGKFLGLARLSIDELRRNPVQKQTLALQSRPSDNNQPRGQSQQANLIGGLDLSDSIGGELHLELMFLEHSNSSGAGQQTIRRSTSAHSISSLGGADQGDVVSVDRKLTPSGYLITTTTISKPANQQHRRDQPSRDRLSPSGRNHSPVSSATEQSGLLEMSSLDGASNQLSQRSGDQASQQMGADETDGARTDSRLSRSRSRSRGFLRAIKRRFSFSRSRRSRSASESASPTAAGYSRSESASHLPRHHNTNMDAISIDSRSRASSEVSVSVSGRAKSMPASRDSNEVPTIVINRSRLSDASSAFTFAQPKSQLVIECQEPKLSDGGGSKNSTLIRHYAIPDDPASERRWRRRGIKLHVFNEHQFVACHLAGSSTCHLCGRVFSRRPGKQGYKCRNCHLLSHKQCHVKVDHNCPYAAKDGLKLEYIDANPPASLVLEKVAANSQQQQQASGRQSSRSMLKSVSVELDDR